MLDETKRTLAIGGSEISAIYGLNEFLDEFGLWVRKKGGFQPDPPDARMLLGKFLEKGIVAYYSHLTGREHEWRDITERHSEYPFMAYTVDAVICGERRGVDAKYVAFNNAWKWGNTVDRIPPHAVMQAWWYMAALDYLYWDLAVLVSGEDQPRIYTVERDVEAEASMLRRAKRWWERYLVGDERPPITYSNPAQAWLKKTYPRNKSDIRTADQAEIALLDEYAMVRQDWRCLDERRDQLETQLKEAVADSDGLKWPGGKFTWKLTRDSEHVEWEGLARLLLADHAAPDQMLREFTTTKPGIRRIYFKDRRGFEEAI